MMRNTVSVMDSNIELSPVISASQVSSEEEDIILDRGGGTPDTNKKHLKCAYLGFVLAVISSLCFSLCSVIVKILHNIHAVNLSIYRFCGILIPTIPIIIYRRVDIFPKGKRLMLLLRSLFGASSLMLQFYAFQHMELADASVLVFSVPVFVAVFARIFLKELCGIFNVVIILLTLVGVVLIAKPPFLFGGVEQVTSNRFWGVTAAMVSVIFAANVYVMLRLLRGLDFSVILFNFSVTALFLTMMLSFLFNVCCLPQCGTDRMLVLLIGVFSFLGQILLTISLKLEEAGPVSLARTADVVFAFIWQILYFKEEVDFISFLGAFLVVSCVILTGMKKWILVLPDDSVVKQKLIFLTK